MHFTDITLSTLGPIEYKFYYFFFYFLGEKDYYTDIGLKAYALKTKRWRYFYIKFCDGFFKTLFTQNTCLRSDISKKNITTVSSKLNKFTERQSTALVVRVLSCHLQ